MAYLLLVNLYLVLFYCFYALLLRRETFFQLNRVYLVSSAMLSFFIPLIQAGWIQNMFITQKVEYTIYSDAITIHSFRPVQAAATNLGELFAYLYLAGVAFLIIKLTTQLIHLRKIIKLSEQGAAYSFFKKIKLDMALNANNAIAAHEQVHAKQWHSADVMIMEAVMIVNWFNPVVYFYRRAIKHIHEFIADSRAVKSAPNKSDYALLLLSHTFNAPQHHLVNHFFTGSLLKQRLIMLQKNKSHRVALLKYALSAPLFILMLVLSSATVNNSRAIRKVDFMAQTVFKQPVVGSVIAQAPATIKTNTIINKPQEIVINPKPDSIKKSVVYTNIDSVKAVKIDRVHSLTFQNQVPGAKSYDYGDNTAQGEQLTKVRSSGLEYIPDNSSLQRKEMIQVKEIYPDATRDIVFSLVDIQPRCEGFDNYLVKTLKYPADFHAENIQGKAIVSFIVEKDGSVTNVHILHSPDERLDAELLRVVGSSPKWSPGYYNGKAVRVMLNLPVSFISANGNTFGITGAAPIADTTKKLTNVTLLPPAPLYILDGKEITPNGFKVVDPMSIQRIDILKDKQAKLIYGEKGANGVIVITTKKHVVLEKDKRTGF